MFEGMQVLVQMFYLAAIVQHCEAKLLGYLINFPFPIFERFPEMGHDLYEFSGSRLFPFESLFHKPLSRILRTAHNSVRVVPKT
jgi:hypothetical protein